MIELEQIPDSNIIIVTALGKITGDDYESILIPATEATLRQYDKLRLLYIFGEAYDGFEGEAMWDDSKVGLKDFTHFEKSASSATRNGFVELRKPLVSSCQGK